MEEESGFDSVQWDREHLPVSPGGPTYEETTLPHRSLSERRLSSNASEPQSGNNTDAVDLAGQELAGILECVVESPIKENDGTKDAYVSYKITTHVCKASSHSFQILTSIRVISIPS